MSQHEPTSNGDAESPIPLPARSNRSRIAVVAAATLVTAGIVTAVVLGTRGDPGDGRVVPPVPPTQGAGATGATGATDGREPAVPPSGGGVSTGSSGVAVKVQPDDPPQTPVTTLPTAKPSGNVADGHPQCPTSVPVGDFSWVPKPANRLVSESSLVPAGALAAAVICRFPVDPVVVGPNTAPPGARPYPIPVPPSGGVLWGRAVLSSGLATLAADLATAPRDSGVPRPCTLIGGGRTAYLLGLEYAGGVVWVRADVEPNHCDGSTNGEYMSSAGYGEVFASAFASRTWVGTAALNARTTGCYPRAAYGQKGQEDSLATGEPLTVTICATPAYDPNTAVSSTDKQPVQPSVRLGADQAGPVLQALRALPGTPGSPSCQPPDGGKIRPTSYRVTMDYANGGSVYVDVLPGCRPEVLGMQLRAADGSAVVAAIKAVAPSLP